MEPEAVYQSVLAPCGMNNSDCGYCKSKESSVSFGMVAKKLTCKVKQRHARSH